MGSLTLIRWAIALVAALVTAGGLYFGIEQRGGRKAIAKVEKQNVAGIENANTAGARSRDPKSRGMLDPYARHD